LIKTPNGGIIIDFFNLDNSFSGIKNGTKPIVV